MSDTAWLDEVAPHVLDDNHRWSWMTDSGTGARNLLWVHRCAGGKWSTGWIDIASGQHHRLISEEPLHIEASVACQRCPDHGFIRDGKWVPA